MLQVCNPKGNIRNPRQIFAKSGIWRPLVSVNNHNNPRTPLCSLNHFGFGKRLRRTPVFDYQANSIPAFTAVSRMTNSQTSVYWVSVLSANNAGESRPQGMYTCTVKTTFRREPAKSLRNWQLRGLTQTGAVDGICCWHEWIWETASIQLWRHFANAHTHLRSLTRQRQDLGKACGLINRDWK